MQPYLYPDGSKYADRDYKRKNGRKLEKDMILALEEACGYRFLRIISEEGAAVYGLLKQLKDDCMSNEKIDKKWFGELLAETENMAVRYPVYLKRRLVETPDFSKNALAILRLQADGMSMKEIAKNLGIKEETVRYHVKQNYKKLGVSGKADAVLVARNLKLL